MEKDSVTLGQATSSVRPFWSMSRITPAVIVP
jgi:hypothetical protein